MARILGLDLGTNSLGWALIDHTKNEILGMGTRIFPAGVEDLGQGEKELSKNATRTGNRQTRRQHARRRLRKRILLKVLAQNGMCPLSAKDLKNWTAATPFPEEALREWFNQNPYELRKMALNQKIELQELGRILYHMIQRRGFQSNARKGSSEEGVLFDGKPTAGKVGINETLEEMQDHTLGSYLHELLPRENEPFEDGKPRARNRYTTRSMYVEEFNRIWTEQSKHHRQLTEELRLRLGGLKSAENDDTNKDGVLFYQRPLRSQKSKVGKCSLEPNKTRCPINALPYEKFRLWQWVNTVQFNGHWMNDEQRKKTFDYLIRRKDAKFSAIRKHLGLADTLIKSNYQDADKIAGSNTISLLCDKKFIGERWFKLSEKEQEDIWHAMYFYDDKEKLKQVAVKQWKIAPESAKTLAGTNLKDGYSNLSRKAILNILPFLEQGHQYDIATALGGVKNLFGSKWENLNEDEHSFLDANVPDIVRHGELGGFLNPLMALLEKEFSFSEREMKKKLYHHSSGFKEGALMDKLPLGIQADREMQSVRNPVVITAMFELRKVVNELIERFGKPDRIVVEMARDLKQSKSARAKVRRKQQANEKYNDKMKAELTRHGQRINHDNLLLIKLWYECQHTCPYTGREININQLFSGDVQIEHIQPWSRSLNDSFMNKTLCFADENRKKGDQTPFEFYSKQGEAKWDEVRARALKLFYDTTEFPDRYKKFQQFAKKTFDEDFISRQLNDTRYISKLSKDYLTKVCNDVRVSPGQVTAKLRHFWGLNTLIGDTENKERDDHRHHAIDALTVACTTQATVQKLSRYNRYHRDPLAEEFPDPWKDFRLDAERMVSGIIVSHKRTSKDITVRDFKTKKKGKEYRNRGIAARGPLHLETVYGKRKSPEKGEEAFHVRKPIDSLKTLKQVEKVVDPVIRDLIHKRVAQMGGYEGTKKDTIPKGAFFSMDENGHALPQIFLPNRNGDPVPIRKVRLSENLGNAEELKDGKNAWVNPRNNHHVLIYKDNEGDLKEDVVTFWTVVERRKQGLPAVILPEDGKEIVTSMRINDMYSLKGSDEVRRVYRVQKLSSKFYEFRLHSESSIDKKDQPAFIRIQSFGEGKTGWLTFDPQPIVVSPSGMIDP